jgi:beta-glucosidase
MRVLRETFLSTFKAAIQEGGALSVMPSYNEIDGVPSHANRWLIEEVLRGEWGFTGFTVSDYFAIRELNESRTQAPATTCPRDGMPRCCRQAGVDIELLAARYPHLSSWLRGGSPSR